MSILPKIVWPIPANNRGNDFGHQDDILSHLAGESTGLYLIGRNGMWHGGIHITHATTPWCALSGHAASEILDFPGGYRGEQAVRCMVDGEVVAYRICKDYMPLKWETGPLSFSGSFVLVRHYIQLGELKTSGLHFYTLYMHLAPYSAYNINPAETKWTVLCSLSAYEPGWVLMASTNNESLSENYRKGTLPKGAIVEWDKHDGSLHTTAFNNREYGLVTFVGLTDEAVKAGYSTALKPGLQYWILVDNNNLAPGTDGVTRPTWWQHLQPPAKEVMKFDQVVCPTPYPINAGDPIGHMGYYQAAKDGGYEARYQVHIECMSMDENLENFLTNPEQFGKSNPLYLKYSPGLTLYRKDVATDTFIQDTRVTTRTGILLLNQIATEVDESTKQEYWQLRPENGYALKGQAEPQLLSQYDLAKLGFRTDMEDPSCFDYLDGKTQPTGFFRNVINALYDASKDDFRVSHALVKYNYQRLLNKIDSQETYYSNMEYWRAFHNPDYRNVVHKTIMKHPSDWYFKKDDAIWLSYLNTQKKEAPEWKAYGEAFLDKMAWMQDVTTEKLGPSLWHMHPVMFLGKLMSSEYDLSSKAGTIHAIIAECKKQGLGLNSQIAYVLATVKRETGDTFQPVREGNWTGHTVTDAFRKKHFRYYPYYGRGYVQITWDYNYRTYSEKLGVDLVGNPDLALEPNNALFILVDGFVNGMFTGQKISDYINETKIDFFNARKCINGLDCAQEIKKSAEVFLTLLDSGQLS